MAVATGPESLPQFEDRLLYVLVELTGDRPLSIGEGVSEAVLAERLADELGITPGFPQAGDFHSSQARGTVLAAVDALEVEGLVQADKVLGPWTIRPTRDGRRRVMQWRKEWEQNRQAQDREAQRRILEELDHQRRADPERHRFHARVDVENLCAELGVDRNTCLANARRLLDQRRIAHSGGDQQTLADGYVYITEAGTQSLEAATTAQRPQRDAQEAWVEVAKLRRRLQVAERTLPSLIADDELRRRCQDLLIADGDYDRVIREACVVLEDRVRAAVGADSALVGTSLMERAFSTKGGPLRLADVEQEQLGALQIYRGAMAFFRNAAGHRLIDTYSQDDALRFVAFVDLLLKMVGAAISKTGANIAT